MTVRDEYLSMPQALDRLLGGHSLSRSEAGSVMTQIMNGSATAAQIAGVATALRMKGETRDEICGFADVMRGAPSELRRFAMGCWTPAARAAPVSINSTYRRQRLSLLQQRHKSSEARQSRHVGQERQR